ncbi:MULTISPECIES: ASCH domain-containing protein [Sporosarcina]|uniref:ASCH domain-containing protein n=1 Tax=Sporosarcina TaxID=1569 RepID=UPI000B043660|nr:MULTISPECIES: ASCH domain-containing protein [Sporosarcina]WJY27901.1 ASCH domain-containing protein [Sporosarcina sp. 0.2-SM1T-5]
MEYPEKTCSVERLVTVPEDVRKVLEGKKTATRRNGVYAYPGEIMTLEGREFEVKNLYEQSLGEVTEEHARQEGFDSLDAYKQSILGMHEGMKWIPAMKVWVHEFAAVEN